MQAVKKTIFVVDDYAPFLEEYKRILESRYNLITFTRPSDVLERMLECKKSGQSIDLLITDQEMGTQQLTGTGLIRKAHEIMPIKYLVVTSLSKEYMDDQLDTLRDRYKGIEIVYMAKSREPVVEIDDDALLKNVEKLIGK